MRPFRRPSHSWHDTDHWQDHGFCRPTPCGGHFQQQPFAIVPNDGGMVVSVQGNAVAAGQATYTQATSTVEVLDRGRFTIAYGQTSFTALATSAKNDTAFAAADCNLQIDNADVVLSTTVRSSGQGIAQGRAWAQDSVQISFLALNIEGLNFSIDKSVTVSTNICAPEFHPAGNLAVFDVDVTAVGDDSFADALIENIAVEDQLSLTALDITAAVDNAGVDPTPRIGSIRSDLILKGAGDQLIWSGAGNDVICTAGGDDLILSGKGHDVVWAGSGDNTVASGVGNDLIVALAGDDWIFAGDGNDLIEAGGGDNVVDGGHGNDVILCGDGDDVVRGGRGNDTIDLGGGTNVALLGERGGDGNDHHRGGKGADLFVIQGEFGRDTISGFSVKQGDRLILEQAWSNDNDLRKLNGSDLLLQRSSDDPRDLELTLKHGSDKSVLTLDDFFRLNPEYAAPQRGQLTDQQALPLLHGLLGTEDLLDPLQPQLQYLTLSDIFSDIA